MGVNPLTLMGDVTKTEFLLTIYDTTEKKNNNFQKNSRVKIGILNILSIVSMEA